MGWGLRSQIGSQKGSAKTDTVVKLVLIFFISLLSFSVGTFVGKQFSDSQYKMAALEGHDESDRDPASVDPSAMDVTPSDALTEDDMASLEEEFTKGKTTEVHEKIVDAHGAKNDEKHVERVVASEHKKEEPAEKHEVTHEKVIEKTVDTKKVAPAATKVAKGETPVEHAETHAAPRKPTALPLKTANDISGKYTVQLASYSVEADAVEHTKSLKEKGFSAFYVPADIKGKPWYRVNVGLYSTSKEAEENKKKMITQPDIKAAIVTKVTQN
jgi:septal ring-binding cell division protein DamX